MKKLGKFIAIGTIFSTVEEFLTVVVLRHDTGSYVFTLLVLFPVFLTLVFYSSRLLDGLFSNEPAREVAHYLVYGAAGLMIEWFLIGLSPWSNPQANWILMLVFQLGMFSFWATVGFVPRLFLNPAEASVRTRKSIAGFYAPYFLFVYLVAAIAPREKKFGVLIPLILFGYLFLNVFYLRYFQHQFSSAKSAGNLGG